MQNRKSTLIEIPKKSSKPREDWEFRILKRIGSQIRKDLVKNGLSVDRLSIDSETSRGSVRRIIAGNCNVNLITLDRIVRTLGYDDVIEFFTKLKK
jgi:hypothetical protein